MGVPRVEADDSVKLATAEDDEVTAMAPQSGRFPPPTWQGQEDDPAREPETAAEGSAGLPGP